MSTTATNIEITCPEWCSITPEEHVRDLWNNGGDCIHWGEEVPVIDTTGWHGALEEPRYHRPVRVWFSTIASPENRETQPATLNIEGHELSVSQALELADEIRRQVERYRAAGGVA